VEARFLDDHGGPHQVAGRVIRNAAGELAVESWSDGVRQETAVPRDASVDIAGRRR
jgi:hypothetical protein